MKKALYIERKIKRNMKRKNILLLIGGLLIGFAIGIFVSLKDLKAENLKLTEEKTTSPKHGYGSYIPFEYEIINSSYGNFVVVRPRYGNSTDFHVAGIKP